MLPFVLSCVSVVAVLAAWSIVPLTLGLAATGDSISLDVIRTLFPSVTAPLCTVLPAVATGHLRLWTDAVLRHRDEKYITRRLLCDPDLRNPGFFDVDNTFSANLSNSYVALHRLHNTTTPRNETLEAETDAARSIIVFVAHMAETVLYFVDVVTHTTAMVTLYPLAVWYGTTSQEIVDNSRLPLCRLMDAVHHKVENTRYQSPSNSSTLI